MLFQIGLQNDSFWYQFLADPLLFINFVSFKSTELGQNIQFTTFDTRRAGLYTPEQMKNLRDVIIHSLASDTVLKKLTRILLTQEKAVRVSNTGFLERLRSRDGRFLMDH